MSVDGLEQVRVVKIENKLLKVFQAFHDGQRAAALGLGPLLSTRASTDATPAPGSIALLVGLVVLSVEIRHLRGWYLLLSSPLPVGSLLIQGLPTLFNRGALPGSQVTSPHWMYHKSKAKQSQIREPEDTVRGARGERATLATFTLATAAKGRTGVVFFVTTELHCLPLSFWVSSTGY